MRHEGFSFYGLRQSEKGGDTDLIYNFCWPYKRKSFTGKGKRKCYNQQYMYLYRAMKCIMTCVDNSQCKLMIVPCYSMSVYKSGGLLLNINKYMYMYFHFCCISTIYVASAQQICVASRFVSGSTFSITPYSEKLSSLAVACGPMYYPTGL